MRWVMVGLNGPDPKRATFNARSETVETSSLWRVPFRKRRCLVPVPAYVEWRKPEREPFRFELVDQPIFALAGLWVAARNPADCTWLQSFTTLTTLANTLASPVHARMPVILERKHYDEWLDREEAKRPPLHLLRPFDPEAMQMLKAHLQIGNVKNQGPEMLNGE
jgi:putative SOS response-associated peptidase YedK